MIRFDLRLAVLGTALLFALGGLVSCTDAGDAGSTTTVAPPPPPPAPPAGGGTGEVTPEGAEPEETVPLAIFSLTPDKGQASGLDQVEILGAGFRGGLVVTFAESLATDFFVLDDSRIIVLTPPRQPGLVDVSVVDAETGEAAVLEAGYLYYNPVSVVGIDPASGHVMGGEAVTLTGAGFVEGSQVLIGGKAAINVQIVNDSTLLATTPDSAHAGVFDVHVSNELGIGSMEDGYVYYRTPAVTSVVPPTGLLAGGDSVEIRGLGFTDPVAVSFAGQPLEDVEIIASDTLSATTPAGVEAGPVDVFVTTEYGVAVLEQGFSYLADMSVGETVEIIAVTPPAGPAAGGNAVTIIADGLTTLEDTEVRFGEKAAEVKGIDPEQHTLLVLAPSGDEGAVDVTVSNSLGSATAEAAYTYLPFIKIYEVLPNLGPTDGGTAVTISGTGFEAGLQLRIGALPASAVTVVDGETIHAVTPPGSPGLANITIMQGELEDTLVGGFAYQSTMELWVVAPPEGSQAGGTQISLAGSGFPDDSLVFVGGGQATHVVVESPTEISAKTPPGEIGTADVTVVSASKGTVTLPQAYTYYNPSSSFGGTWGNEVDGTVNVSVIDGSSGMGMPDAFVMLWTDPDTPYQGYTNYAGQITFSGPDLMGEQMVSASKDGFASQSVVEYNAENITLFMTPNPPPSPGAPPSFTPPMYHGTVANASKYIPVPWGECWQKTDAPGTLCDPCTTSADCAGLNCSFIPAQGNYCTSHCVNNNDCPDGFMCIPLNGVTEQQCVPSSGKVTAFCDFTKPAIFSDDYLPAPGQQVNDDFTFDMIIPIGEVAVFCWGGIEDPNTLSFTPYALGIDRHVFAQPGDVFEETVWLQHPLTSPMTIRLDDPPKNPTGPDFNYAFIHLDLGSDGTLEFLDHPYSWTSSELVAPRMPKDLTGDLYDASYTILAGAFSATEDNLPASLTLHYGIRDLEDDTMYVWEGDEWLPQSTGIVKNINDMSPVGADGLVGVGTDGWIIHSMGTGWGSNESGTSLHLKGVDGLPSGDAIAVGEDGLITHFDGLVWTVKATGTLSDFQDVWMASESDAFAVGWYQVYRYNGGTWTKMLGNTSKNLQGVFGFASDDVWAVGNYGQVIHFDGAIWSNVSVGTSINLRAVWGASPDDVWIVGEGGMIIHWDGTQMTPYDSGTTRTITNIWGGSATDIYAVGERGLILRWDGAQWLDESPKAYESSFLAVAGAAGRIVASGTHELLLGPMLQVPENISPSDGEVMGDDYTVSWTVKDGVDPHFTYAVIAIPGMFDPVPEWIMINDYYVTEVHLPDFPNIEGTPGITAGPEKYFSVIRAYKEGFDINNYSMMDLNQTRWRSWAWDRTTFSKQ